MKYSRLGTRGNKHFWPGDTREASALIVRALAFLLVIVVCVAGIRWISGSPNSYSDHPTAHVQTGQGLGLAILAGPQAKDITSRNRRPVYPYSVVPGGVASTAELQEIAAHDSTVADHYKDFNYRHGHVVEVDHPRSVYLSYRRGNRVYWTRKQVSLRVGEKLLTDGHISARTRCGNQVSVLPQANTSPDEPTEAELDRPDAVASGIRAIPANLDSSLLNVDPAMPIAPSSGGSAFGGLPPGVFVPPSAGGPGGGGIGGGPGGGCPPQGKVSTSTTGNCTPPPPPPPPPPTVPEPASLVLVLSGAAAMYARFHMKKS